MKFSHSIINKLFGTDNTHIKVFFYLLNNGDQNSFNQCAKAIKFNYITFRNIITDFEDVGIVWISKNRTGGMPKYLSVKRFGINRSSPITVALIQFLSGIETK